MSSGIANSYAGGGSGSSGDELALLPELELAGVPAAGASSRPEQPAAKSITKTASGQRVVFTIRVTPLYV